MSPLREMMFPLSLLRVHVALAGLLWASCVEGAIHTSRICQPSPHWEIKGQAPMQELQGNVVVVALLKAS